MKKLNMKVVLGIIIGVVVIQTVIICCLLFKDKEINVAETNNNETSENLVVNTTTDTMVENNTESTDTEIDTNTELDGSETSSTNDNATTSSNSNVSTSNKVTNEVKPVQKTEPTNNSSPTNNTSNTSTTNTNSNSHTSTNNTPSSNNTANNNSSNNTQNNTNNNTNTSTNKTPSSDNNSNNTNNNTNTNTDTNANAGNNNSNSNTSSEPKEEVKEPETVEPDTKEELSIEYEYINGFKILGYINIPKTGINLPVLEDYSIKALETSVVKMYGADLNKVGNAVITGHNYRNGKFFSNNKNLAVGDVIYITDATDKKITYVVYDVFETEPSDSNYMTRGTNGKREISLTTATDDAKNRLIVLAREK